MRALTRIVKLLAPSAVLLGLVYYAWALLRSKAAPPAVAQLALLRDVYRLLARRWAAK